LFSARDVVAIDTPAMRAMSTMLTFSADDDTPENIAHVKAFPST
jgi:hypothetical protein